MKTLIFSILLLICGLNSVARADDPYDNLPWAPYHASVTPNPVFMPHPLTVASFRTFFRTYADPQFMELMKEYGVPSDILSVPAGGSETLPAHLPMYHGGHLYRYHLPDGGHVYVWSGGDDAIVMRADYFSSTGRVQPLYVRSIAPL